jgi:predicted RNase H-like HicB family nuclease
MGGRKMARRLPYGAVCSKLTIMTQFTAVYKKSGKWYLGWVEEIPGVNTQGKTLAEAKENLKEALRLIVETNQLLTKQVGRGKIIREKVALPA